jgi:hypothetical protein
MNENLKAKKAIKAILAATGFHLNEFARMIGASLDTVKSWSAGRNSISAEFRSRILLSTGAQIEESGEVTTHWRVGSASGFSGEPFSRESFAFWREKVSPSDAPSAEMLIKRGAAALDILFRAAALPVNGKKNKLPGISRAFEEWLIEVTENFALEPVIAKIQKSDDRDFFWHHWRRVPGTKKNRKGQKSR